MNVVILRTRRELVEVQEKKKEQPMVEEGRVPKHLKVNEKNMQIQSKKKLIGDHRLSLGGEKKKNDDYTFNRFLDILTETFEHFISGRASCYPKIC